jgi:protein-S-isoprenylcysteine O-methyltransferase Ste14
VAGRWPWPAYVVALLLVPMAVGLLILLYMHLTLPDGTLTVAYSRRDLVRQL